MNFKLPYSSKQVIHSPRPSWSVTRTVVGIILSLCVFVPFLFLYISPSNLTLAVWLFAGFAFIFGIYTLIEARNCYLVTSPNGIEYKTPFTSVWAHWQDVVSIRIGRGGYYLLVRDTAPGSKLSEFLGGAKTIPISYFCGVLWNPRDWQNDALGSELHRYAPHLFKKL